MLLASCAAFDGSTSPHLTLLPPHTSRTANGGHLSLSLWAYPNRRGGWGEKVPLLFQGRTTLRPALALWLNADGTVTGQLQGHSVQSTVRVDENQWTHAVLRCRSDRAVTIAELFINGELVATNEMETNPLHSREPIFLAGLPASVTRSESDKVTPFVGLLDDVRLFSSALSSEEIGSLYGRAPEYPPPSAPAVPRASRPIKHLAELVNWQPGADPVNVSHVALRSRPHIDDALHRQQRIHCHDMAGGYLDDRFATGCATEHIYNFYNWQFVDTFIYFSHHRITVPPVGWIDAAHRNGVKVLGTFITEWDESKPDALYLLDGQPGESRFFFADKMIAMAKYYGFDGWFFNIECGLDSPENSRRMASFIDYMKTASKRELGDGALVIWYDSVTNEGVLKWQNQLNEKNEMFLDASDGIFVNYAWTEEMLCSSHARARERSHDVYFGIDCWGRGTYGGGQYHCYKALQAISDLQCDDPAKGSTSVAFFAPAWTFEGRHGGREGFESVERRFWLGSSSSERFHFDLDVEPTFLATAGQALVRPDVIKEDKWFVENGGGGWKLLQGDNVGPNVALSGQNVLQASHDWCRRGREFDLVQLLDSEIGRRGVSGFDTAGLLDRFPPSVSFGEWYAGGPPNCADLFYLKVELRDGDHKPLMSFDSTVLTAVPEWRLVSSTLFGFGPGVRYLYWEDGAKDVENWAGHFGTKIAGAFLEFKWHPNDQLARLGIRESIASYLPEREAPCALPFYTNFDQGVGHRLFSAGELVREGEWSHLSRQSLQPTYRYGQRVASCGDCIEFGIGHDLAFEGGSCLLVSGQFDSRVPAPGEAPYQLARLFKTCLALPTGDRSALLLVSITHRPETPNATVELVLELDDASLVRLATPTRSPARPLLEGKTAGEVLVIEAAHVDRLHGWDRAAYRVPADVLGGRRVVGLALLSQDLTREPSRASTGLTAFKARVGEIRINSAQPTQDENQPTSTAAASWWFPRPPPVCRLQGRTSWTIASLHPHLASSANLAQEEESGGAKEVRLANVWLTWERPTAADRAQEVESCDVYFAGKFLGRSYANGYFAENVLYEAPTRADDSEGEVGEKEVVGEFAVVSVSPLGVTQRMADAARVVVKW